MPLHGKIKQEAPESRGGLFEGSGRPVKAERSGAGDWVIVLLGS